MSMDAKETLRQLGGNRFIAMTGANTFIRGDDWISFRIPRAKDGINYVKITLNGKDLYDMEFAMIRAPNVYPKGKETDLYDDMLQPTFTEHTGLYTRL